MEADLRTQAARQFASELARLAANTRCTNVIVLDVSGLSPVTDVFVLATGTSPRQMRSITEEAAEFGEQKGFHPLATSGLDGSTWMLIDFFDVVLHVFNAESRRFYDLDNLWGDAQRVAWESAAGGSTAPKT